MAGALTEISSWKCFGGLQKVFQHHSEELKCDMKVSVFLPPQATEGKVPVLYWLSGLTCTHENFIQKAGAQRYAAKRGLAIVAPDTSPRGCNIEGEEDGWDFGTGAGFYVDATEEKWKKNYRMFSYVTKELPELINNSFPVIPDKQSIFGHSMGGHGALICALKCPGQYKSVSAFAPICNPIKCPWGQKAFGGYLGADQNTWKEWDATELCKQYDGPPLLLLVDQGKDDNFLKQDQLLPEHLVDATKDCNRLAIEMRMQEGYDHSYFFISSFVGDHIEHHAKALEA